MLLDYKNLTANTREHMLSEIAHDVSEGSLYISNRLTKIGAQSWEALVTDAAKQYDDEWLAKEIQQQGLMNTHEERRKPTGGTTTAKVPANANTTLAEGEFNRFYIRGLCQLVINNGGGKLQVYRARQSSNPRPESEALVGKFVDPHVLLADLRASPGVETALGLPPGPNSGLSVRIP